MRGSGFPCDRCNATFRDAFNLRRHQARKQPCEPFLDPPTDEPAKPSCRYCGRAFTTTTAMYRHVRSRCKIANSEEGMKMLMEHTLQRQLAAQTAKVDALQAQMAELTALLKTQLVIGGDARPGGVPGVADAAELPLPGGALVGVAAQVNTGPVTNQVVHATNVQINKVTIRPWSEGRIVIPVAMLRATFTENPRLIEYCRMSDNERVDAERAAPYVLEALVDLVKRAHADPAGRNVYLNPRRADQVLVCDEAWKVLPLVEAIRDLFDRVAGRIHEIFITERERAQLPFEVQAAASWVPSLYEAEPEAYVQRAKGSMSAHFVNTAPPGARPARGTLLDAS